VRRTFEKELGKNYSFVLSCSILWSTSALLFENKESIWKRASYELLTCIIIFNHSIGFGTLFRNEQSIWKRALYYIFICLFIFNRMMDFGTLFGGEESIWKQASYELFICLVIFHHMIDLKTLFGSEESIPIGVCYKLFICVIILNYITYFWSLFWNMRSIWTKALLFESLISQVIFDFDNIHRSLACSNHNLWIEDWYELHFSQIFF
jgi:hypothetical protein